MSMSVGRVVALVAGGFGVAVGLLGLAASGGMSHWLVFGAVLLAGGAALLLAGLRDRLPAPWAWVAVVLLAAGGTAASLLVVREEVCCMFVYHEMSGYPWPWLHRSGEAETMRAVEAIRADAANLPVHLDRPRLVAAAVFWTHAAILAVVPAAALLHRPTRAPAPAA